MPLIIISGCPSSGKTTRALQLEKYFSQLNYQVKILSESNIIQSSRLEKNQVFLDSNKEKLIRGSLKSETQRLLDKNIVLILDAGNYIKGYRYELFCVSKLNKTPQCTLQCEISNDLGWEWNLTKVESEQYSKEVYDALRLRFEEPDGRNRWDSPLFITQPNDELPFNDIFKSLFNKKAPRPNQSTEVQSVNRSNFTYDLDSITQEIVNAFLQAKSEGIEGEFKIPKYINDPLILPSKSVTLAQLGRLRNQFINYTKLNPCEMNKIATLFVHYLNNNF